MTTRCLLTYSIVLVGLLQAPAVDAQIDNDVTIKSLETKDVEVRTGNVIIDSTDLARDSYRAFLDLASDDAELRAEAMRRLGDLELDAIEAEQLVANIDTLVHVGYDSAISLYQQLLEDYPDYPRNDLVLYQLGRAYEIGGRSDEALAALNELVDKYPDTPLIAEAQFRRGEMLFLRKQYNDAEAAYRAVVIYGERSRFYERSLYKLGWSQFKLAWHEDSLEPFFELLDRKIGHIELSDGDNQLERLSRADQELIEDTFRVLSISFSYMEGAATIRDFFSKHGRPGYDYVIYRNLGDLYLEKERFVDAAEAYAAFVAQDAYHQQAPLLQAEVIEAYKLGGFPSLVLDGKREFADLYRMDGQFWQRNPDEDSGQVVAYLKANLHELAQYYHAEAQQHGKISDYQQAAGWYRKYLDYFPSEPDSASINFLLAESLFDSQSFEEATYEYEQTAYSYPRHEQSAEAAHAAMLAYREHEKSLEASALDEWHSQYLDSGLKFANTYPEHPESAAMLTTVAEDLFAQNEFDLAIAVGQIVVARQPQVAAPLSRTAWTVIAHSQFDLDNFAEAEQAYFELRNYTPPDDPQALQDIKDRIASSIYKQGEAARDAGDLESAVGHFTRLGQAVPDADIRAVAEYDAAAALINLQAWDRASDALEKFRRDYPDSEFNDDVARNLAATYLGSGRAVAAATEFERIATAASSDEDMRREALWKAAELYEQSGSTGSEQRVLEDIITRFPDPLSESLEARVRLLEIARAAADDAAVVARLQSLIQVDATAAEQRSDRSRYLAAKASLELAEPVRRRFTVVKLQQPLADSMKLKRSLMEEVIEVYTKAADYGVAEVTTASTYRLGEVYEVFSHDLIASERPSNLDAEALEQYELLLEEQVYPFEEKAIELYKLNADRASQGVYDEWISRSFDRLASLMPARYAKSERSEDVLKALY
jgi:TolA-binding protein